MPIRIQRKRVKDWKMPDNTIYVGRPSKWGNPFVVGKITQLPPILAVMIANGINDLYQLLIDGLLIKDNEHAVELYKKFINIYSPKKFAELGGKNLACWCKMGDPCHADILLKIANSSKRYKSKKTKDV